MGIWSRLRILKMFIQLVRDPQRTDLIFKGIELFSSDPAQKPVREVEDFVLANEQFRKMHAEGYLPESPKLANLADFPVGSLGQALYRHMTENNLDFQIFPHFEILRPVHYLSARAYQDHDLWHVLLGYGIEVEDELAIQAFGVAQFNSPVGVMIVAGGLIHLLGRDPARALAAFRKINEAYSLGLRAPFLLGLRLHDRLGESLGEVRRDCGLLA